MDRSTVTERLARHRAELESSGVTAMFLFGSVARDEAGTDSDVDLFFDYSNGRFSLIELARIKRRIQDILGVSADVMTRDSLHPMLKERIEATAIKIF